MKAAALPCSKRSSSLIFLVLSRIASMSMSSRVKLYILLDHVIMHCIDAVFNYEIVLPYGFGQGKSPHVERSITPYLDIFV
jgi:hypothetical protein